MRPRPRGAAGRAPGSRSACARPPRTESRTGWGACGSSPAGTASASPAPRTSPPPPAPAARGTAAERPAQQRSPGPPRAAQGVARPPGSARKGGAARMRAPAHVAKRGRGTGAPGMRRCGGGARRCGRASTVSDVPCCFGMMSVVMENTPLATFSVPPRMPQLSTLRRVLLAAYLRAAPPVGPPGQWRAGAAPLLTSARHVQQGPPDHMNLRRASPACPLSGSGAPLLALGGPRQTSGCGAHLSITTRHPSEEKPRRQRLRLVPRLTPFPPPPKQSPDRGQGAAPRRPGRALQELLHERDRHVHLADALLGLGDAARRRQRGLAVRVAARRARRQRLLRCGQALHLRAEAAAGASPRGCSNTS